MKQGNYGAGCGATVGKIKGPEFAMKGGIGSYSIKLDSSKCFWRYIWRW